MVTRHIDVGRDQFLYEPWKSLQLPHGAATLDDEVPASHVARFGALNAPRLRP